MPPHAPQTPPAVFQVMAHYTRPSLSRTARDRTTSFVKTLATLAETFVFIYIGLSLFLEQQAWDRGLTWAFLVRRRAGRLSLSWLAIMIHSTVHHLLI